MQLAGLLGAVAVAGEDLVGVEPVQDPRGEDRLDVDSSVVLRLACVRDDEVAEVLVVLECARREHEGLEEVGEVAELVARLQVVGQRVVVPLRDRAQRVRPHRPLEMDVQLDLRIRRRHLRRSVGTSV